MNNAIITVVAISHLATSLLLIRTISQKQRLEALNRKQRTQIQRLINVATPPRRPKL